MTDLIPVPEFTRLRCVRCFCIVAPSEATCGGCGRSFTPAEIEAAMEPTK